MFNTFGINKDVNMGNDYDIMLGLIIGLLLFLILIVTYIAIKIGV